MYILITTIFCTICWILKKICEFYFNLITTAHCDRIINLQNQHL